MTKYKKLNWLIDDPSGSINRIFVNLYSLVVAIAIFLTSVFSAFLYFDVFLFLVNIFFSCIFIYSYYLSRFGKKQKLATVLMAVFMFYFIPFFWITNGGSHGPSPLLIMIAITSAFVIFKKKTRIYVVTIYLLVAGILFGIDILYPELIYHNLTQTKVILGIAGGVILSLIVLITFLSIIFSLYSREHFNSLVRHRELKKTVKKFEEIGSQWKKVSLQDGLTGIPNRRYFDEILHKEVSRLRRKETSITLLLLDIDHFKSYNDKYGHLAGDDCLKHFGRILTMCIKRPTDVVARYGGEEFGVILPDTEQENALCVVKRIQAGLDSLKEPDVKRHVTASIGVASISSGDKTISMEDLIHNADKALYQAKLSGRNTVRFYDNASISTESDHWTI